MHFTQQTNSWHVMNPFLGCEPILAKSIQSHSPSQQDLLFQAHDTEIQMLKTTDTVLIEDNYRYQKIDTIGPRAF